MNKIKNKLNKLIKSARGGRRNRRRRNRRRRRFINVIKQTSFVPQSLGSGRTTINVEKIIEQGIAYPNVAVAFQIGTILNTSYEFLQFAGSYRYMKILKIAVVFEPNQILNSAQQRNIYVQMNWGNGETDNLQYEESSKIVPGYRTRKIVLKYLVPNIILRENERDVNLKSWLPAVDTTFTSIGGYLYFQCDEVFTLKCRIIVRVAFAGNRVRDPSSMKQMYEEIENKISFKKTNRVIDGFLGEELNKENFKKINYEGYLEKVKKKIDENKNLKVEEGENKIINENNINKINNINKNLINLNESSLEEQKENGESDSMELYNKINDLEEKIDKYLSIKEVNNKNKLIPKVESENKESN